MGAVSNLATDNIINVNGEWGLAEWYPGRRARKKGIKPEGQEDMEEAVSEEK